MHRAVRVHPAGQHDRPRGPGAPLRAGGAGAQDRQLLHLGAPGVHQSAQALQDGAGHVQAGNVNSSF